MPINRLRTLLSRSALFLALVCAATPALHAQLDRVVSFSVGDPNLSEGSPDLAEQPGGAFLLVWQVSSPEVYRIGARRFDAAGRPLGPEVELWEGVDPQVASLPDGGFVVASWFDLSLRLGPPSIGLHRLDALGKEIGEPVGVTLDPNFQASSEVRLAVAPNGTVAVVWRDSAIDFGHPNSVFVRFFSAALEPMTDAVLLSGDSANPFQDSPDIAFRSDGVALAVWAAGDGGAQGPQIFGRLFDVTGRPLSDEFPVNVPETQRLSFGQAPRVAAGADGGWWVGWNSVPLISGEVEARVLRLGAGGERLGSNLSLGAPSTDHVPIALGTGPGGKLLVAGTAPDGSISARLFDRDGTTASDPFEVLRSGPVSLRGAALSHRSPGGFLAAGSNGSDISGATFAPACLPGKTAACLGADGRYGIEIAWRNGAESGVAKPLPLAGSVATFGLRHAADHDVAVLLSGAGSRDLTFAATTGAALEIRVTDKTTGVVQTFTKAAGRFASRKISKALPATTAQAEIAVTAGSAGDLAEPAPRATADGTCVPTSRALCLLGGRFRAELLAGANLRPALAILRTDKSGTFAFPSAPEVPLVTLTMIDGRASNGKFWVYLGGLSAAKYQVKVTDLETGQAKVYANPLGRLESRADRTAF